MFRSEYADVPARRTPHPRRGAGPGRRVRRHARADRRRRTARPSPTSQLDRFHRRIAAALAEAGVRKGDVLALHSPNTIAYPDGVLRAPRARAPPSRPCTRSPPPEEFAKQLRDSAASWIVTVSPLLETARGPPNCAGGIREIFVCDSAARPPLAHRHARLDRARTGASTSTRPRTSRPSRTPPARPASPRASCSPTAPSPPTSPSSNPVMPAGPGDRILAVLPFFHIYGLTALMNAPAAARRHRRRPAPLRPRHVPRGHREAPHHRPVRRPADRPRPRQAPGRRAATTSPRCEYILCAAAPLDAAARRRLLRAARPAARRPGATA